MTARERIETVGSKLMYTALGAALAMGVAWGGLLVRVARNEQDIETMLDRSGKHETRISVLETWRNRR